jgi:hypothetical protein
MLSKRILTGCLGALAIGLSPIGAEAAPVAPHAPALSAAIGQLPVAQHAAGDVELARFDTPMSRGVIGVGAEEFDGRDGFGGGIRAGEGFHGGGLRKVPVFTEAYDPSGYGGSCRPPGNPGRGRLVCPGH